MRRHWLWVPTVFAAGEIPNTLLCFLSVLMFLQVGVSPALSTLFCGCLFLSWALLSPLRRKLVNLSHFRLQVAFSELCILLTLMLLAVSFTWHALSAGWLFAVLMLLSLLNAWHHVASRHLYVSVLRAGERPPWRRVAMFFAQVATIATYGLVLMLVGALQVRYRSVRLPWGLGCYITAGVFLLFFLYHLFALPGGETVCAPHTPEPVRRMRAFLSLAVILLPQSLMFLSRQLFLFAPRAEGGLGCTIQEIAFAQGAVGVIGFALGLSLASRPRGASAFWAMALALGLSPCVYLIMTCVPPESLLMLSVCTFTAQFLFGFGLPAVGVFLRQLGEAGLRAAYVSAAFCLPCALSGVLVEALGFRAFFSVNCALSLVCWATAALCAPNRHRHER